MASKAIVIGCADYRFEAIPNLRFAESDARALHERLVDPEVGGFDPTEVALLIAPIHAAASVSLERFLQSARPDDTLVVYFAGHGLRDERGQMYLAVADTHPDLLRATSISARYLRELLDDCRSRRVCVILDCCFSGAFGKGHRSTLNASDVKAAVGPLEGQGTIVLTSSQASQPSLESEQHAHGTFTHYLLEGLDGGADANATGLITPVQLFHFVCERMEREVGVTQRPMLVGDMTGGSFSIARSTRKRGMVLALLEKEVEALVQRHEHATAIERIDGFDTVNAKEQEFVDSLKNHIRGDMVRIVDDYRRQLFKEGGERVISGAVLHDADMLLSQSPEKLFRPANKRVSDKREVLLRNHLVGRINAAAMDDLWPKSAIGLPKYASQPIPKPSIPTTVPQAANSATVPLSQGAALNVPPAERSGRWPSHRLAVLLGVGVFALAAAAVWNYAYTTVPNFDPQHLKLGLVAKRSQPNLEAARQTFKEVLVQLNERMQPRYVFSSEIRTYENPDQAIEALRTGQIDVAGELAPGDIYKANRAILAAPFVSPQYGGSISYFSNIVMPRTSGLIVWKNDAEVDRVRTWSNVLTNLNTGSKLAVSRDQSTAGYWYPRYMVLRSFAEIGNRTRTFGDVAEPVDASQIPATVACDASKKVIAGAIPDFDYDTHKLQKCNGTYVSLERVFESPPIKHGAFVMRKALASDGLLVTSLKGYWPSAVKSAATTSLPLKLEATWAPVDLTYYADMTPVFSEPDPAVAGRLVVPIATSLILVMGATAFVWLRIRRRSASKVDTSATEKVKAP